MEVAWIARVPDPLATLAELADLHDRGLREPLPLFCRTSAAYATHRADPVGAARREWVSAWSFPREDAEREHVLAFGAVLTLEALLAAPAPTRASGGIRWRTRGSASTPAGCGTRCWPTRSTGMSAPFDVCGPLPHRRDRARGQRGHRQDLHDRRAGRALRRRGHAARAVLLVTFTRMATGELRERVRERLVAVERGAGRRGDSPATTSSRCSRPTATSPCPRLRRALADFDAATIATTHGFCQQVLAGLGVAGDPEPDATFVEDVSDLVDEVVDDLYVRRFHREGVPAFDRARRPRRSPARRSTTPSVAAGPRRAATAPEMRRRLAAGRPREELEAAQARARRHDLRRPADPAARARWPTRRGGRPPARPLRRRPGRRVPGHRPGAVGHPAPGVRRRRARRSC